MSIRYWVDKEHNLITIEFRDAIDVCDIASQILHIHGDPACKGAVKRLVDARSATVSGAISAFRALVDLFVWQIQDLGTERIAILVDDKTNMDWALSLLNLIGPSVVNVAICHSKEEACQFLGVSTC